MVVIQRNEPFGAASDALASYITSKRNRAVEDAAASHTASREARQDLESDRTYGLAKNKDTREAEAESDTHSLAQGKLTAQSDAHAKSELERQSALLEISQKRALDPLLLEHQRLQNKVESGRVLTSADAHRMQQLELQIKHVQASHADAMAQLELQLKKAMIARDNAETVRALRPPSAPRSSAGERRDEAFNVAEEHLSPQGNAFLDMLSSGNNPPTRMQALEALRQSRLSGSDRSALKTIIESRNSQFETPGQQYGQGYRQSRDEFLDSRHDKDASSRSSDRMSAMIISSIEKDPRVKKLSAQAHADLIQGIKAVGYDEAVDTYKKIAAGDQALSQARNITPDQARETLGALGISQ